MGLTNLKSATSWCGKLWHTICTFNEFKIEPVLGITGRGTAVSDTSSVSGSVFLRTDEENEMAVGPLPRSKYDRTRR